MGDESLAIIAKDLGFTVEALGMSEYNLNRDGLSLGVFAHDDIVARDRVRADLSVKIWDATPGSKSTAELNIDVANGISIPELETRIRGFIKRLERPGKKSSTA